MVAGKDAARPGEGKNSWLTGTAAWMWLTVSQYILGIKPHYDGLLIDPCLPTTAQDYTVCRRFRDAQYTITIHPNGSQKGVKRIVLDGSPVEGSLVPYTPGGHTVEVTM
jgi:cellobiose phosphorylase